jgi:hypothetical protein
MTQSGRRGFDMINLIQKEDGNDRYYHHVSSEARSVLGRDDQSISRDSAKYQNVAGLLRKNYWMSEDGLRVGGIYLWTSRAHADRVYTPEWKKFVESKYGVPPVIEYLYSPVMVDNREGTISVAAA